ncbi:hypothetical protein, partial [Ferrovum sp.]|uniref:hypothetical protein n=1 Tax=Ferrovum sp. TaxID=2609467 RepID=UPI0026176BCB
QKPMPGNLASKRRSEHHPDLGALGIVMALSLRTSYFLIMSLSQSALDNCTDIQFEKSNKSIVPLAIGHNKLYLCHKESIDHLQIFLINTICSWEIIFQYFSRIICQNGICEEEFTSI